MALETLAIFTLSYVVLFSILLLDGATALHNVRLFCVGFATFEMSFFCTALADLRCKE